MPAREQLWKKSVHDGIVAGAKPVEPMKLTADAKKVAAAVAAEPKPAAGGIEIGESPVQFTHVKPGETLLRDALAAE